MNKNREINFRIRAGSKYLYTGDLNSLKTLNINLKDESSCVWQQSSELRDKHKTTIYEGDILRYNIGKVEFFYVVEFGKYNSDSSIASNGGNGFYIVLIGKQKNNFSPIPLIEKNVSAFEVIGNSFDTPELLEDECDKFCVDSGI